jgi:hypothetical protein
MTCMEQVVGWAVLWDFQVGSAMLLLEPGQVRCLGLLLPPGPPCLWASLTLLFVPHPHLHMLSCTGLVPGPSSAFLHVWGIQRH